MDYCELFKMLDVNEDLGERFRILVDQTLKVFISDNRSEDFIFPDALTNVQRKYVHEKAQNLGLRSKSYGKDPNRRLKISKRHNLYQRDFHLEFRKCDVAKCNQILDQYYSSRGARHNNYGGRARQATSYERILDGRPVYVNRRGPSTLLNFRQQLPTWSMKGEFLTALADNQIVIVSSETGSGKSTQIPQFILDECFEQKRQCRIVCTQPRRLATISVAQRVAEEWGEPLGNTVGYQIRLESMLSAKSSLIYCTNGIMLKSLMNNERCLENYTHVIVDEIHERDKYTDFLLIYLKKNLALYPNLRLILMSATMDIDSFTNYFQDSRVRVMYIPGKLYPVQEYFLDDILPKVDYKLPIKPSEEDSWLRIGRFDPDRPAEPEERGEDSEMNVALMDCVTFGTESAFAQLMQMILCEAAPVNHRTPLKRYTPLIAAAMHGNVEVVEQLLHLGKFVHILKLPIK